MNISSDRDEISGIYDIKVELGGIKLNRAESKLDEEEIEKIKALIDEDPLSLILAWSIDFDYDGSVHRPEVIEVSEDGSLQTSFCSFKIDKTAISINILDIFGNVEHKIYEV